MILLDTDHVSVLKYSDRPAFRRLVARMEAAAGQAFGVTIVSAEEQMRGWLAEINRNRDVHRQVPAYEELARLFSFFSRFPLIPFDAQAADEFKRLRKEKLRIGTMELKIAAIALARGLLLLSSNQRDFQRVPGLRVENWLIG